MSNTAPLGLETTREVAVADRKATADRGRNVVRLILLGFGNVNRALAKMILMKSSDLSSRYGIEFRVMAIVTRRHGTACVPLMREDEAETSFIELQKALQKVESGGRLGKAVVVHTGESYGARGCDVDDADHHHHHQQQEQQQQQDEPQSTTEALRLISNLARFDLVDAVVESIPVSYQDGEPALTLAHHSLSLGLHVVSANKGPVVHAYGALMKAASSNGARYLHESAVMDGVPVFSLWSRTLPLANLTKVRGLLNSTTTIVLSRMETMGETFDEALRYAQDEGIAEADPSGDVDGHDAAVKLAALLRVLVADGGGVNYLVPTLDDIRRDSIRSITPQMIKTANQRGERYRLVATADSVSVDDNGSAAAAFSSEPRKMTEWKATVKLELVQCDDPFYNLAGASSAIELHTDVLGPVTVVSSDPTVKDTAYGLYADLLRAVGTSG